MRTASMCSSKLAKCGRPEPRLVARDLQKIKPIIGMAKRQFEFLSDSLDSAFLIERSESK